ncbi:MAG: nucleotidyltransferase family protein [Acidobacteria bacterium]|nr:nucleotidyltransferase family protein [Acidobacteriota bacterium]
MSKRSVILVGGKGMRLRPYTTVLPKPLMPIGDYPILEVVVRQLAYHGFDHISLAVNHQANIIRAFFGDGSRWNIRIDHSLEEVPLSTVGPLRLFNDLPENFLLMNGDVLTDLDFGRLLDEHAQRGGIYTIAAARREHLVDYGVLHADGSGALTGFEEKPKLNYLVSMGVYAVNRRVLELIPPGRKYGFDNLMIDLLARDERVHVEPHTGYWMDIGRADDYAQAIEDFDRMKSRLIPNLGE